eukprot:jgi/Galph1/5390/GphlegSOOS_G4043.1
MIVLLLVKKNRDIHERLLETRNSRLFWKTDEYCQLYGLLLKGAKPSAQVRHSLFHSKDWIVGRRIPYISDIPEGDEAVQFPIYGLLRCWIHGSSVEEAYSDSHYQKKQSLRVPTEGDDSLTSFPKRHQTGSEPKETEQVSVSVGNGLLKKHLVSWKECRLSLKRQIRLERLKTKHTLRGQELTKKSEKNTT